MQYFILFYYIFTVLSLSYIASYVIVCVFAKFDVHTYIKINTIQLVLEGFKGSSNCSFDQENQAYENTYVYMYVGTCLYKFQSVETYV